MSEYPDIDKWVDSLIPAVSDITEGETKPDVIHGRNQRQRPRFTGYWFNLHPSQKANASPFELKQPKSGGQTHRS